MITNGKFIILNVAYVEGLEHNLISVSQVVGGIGLKVKIDEEGSEIFHKESDKVVLKSKSKCEMYLLNM